MTLLSRKADYALLILSFLHTQGSGNAREIAAKFGLSRAFVANILKELGHKGFVTSTRGVKGGYVLQRASATITLAELLEAVEDGFQLTLCKEHTGGEATCEVESVCPVKTPMLEIQRRIMALLRGVTLADIFAPTTGQPVLTTLGFIARPIPHPVSSTA